MDRLEDLLRTYDFRVTAPRKAVFVALQDATQPLKLSEIVARCPKIDRSSVYRSIDILLQAGVIKVVHIGWKKRYELTELFRPHHHHIRCTQCSQIVHIEDDELESAIETIAVRHRFTSVVHHFEIEGVCELCAKNTQ